MEERGITKGHKVTMTNRKGCHLNGILDVISFDVNEVLLETEQGMLTIKGNDLHVKRLTLEQGELELEGRLDSFVYSEIKEKLTTESFISRLFR